MGAGGERRGEVEIKFQEGSSREGRALDEENRAGTGQVLTSRGEEARARTGRLEPAQQHAHIHTETRPHVGMLPGCFKRIHNADSREEVLMTTSSSK